MDYIDLLDKETTDFEKRSYEYFNENCNKAVEFQDYEGE